jgi:RNA polymerase sigma-70 factor (ECF subfamily)
LNVAFIPELVWTEVDSMEDFNLHPSDKERCLDPKLLDTEPSAVDPSEAALDDIGADDVDADDIGAGNLCSFVEKHYDRTYAYCYRLCGRRTDAEDLCQQVFVTAVKYLGQIRSMESAQAWLATAARRMYWHSIKESSRQSTLLNLQANEPEAPYEPCEKKLERVDWVHQALDQLSPIARIIVVMFYFEDKSYQQIAQELDVPMGTVMSRLSRSKDMLREALLKTAKPVSLVKAK